MWAFIDLHVLKNIPVTHSRRAIAPVLLSGLCFAVVAALGACGDHATAPATSPYAKGRLSARPHSTSDAAGLAVGLSYETIVGADKPVAVYVPHGYTSDHPWPVTLLLHGSLGSGAEMAADFGPYADSVGIVVLAPSAHAYTWDRMATGSYGPDVAQLDTVLMWAFSNINVDPHRVSIAGFSDGATYSLLLGLKNGDLFDKIVSLAPCPKMPDDVVGNPLIFIAQGTNDQVLPIDECSRVIVPELRLAGYNVNYVEYPSPLGDGHYVPPEIASQAFHWLLDGVASSFGSTYGGSLRRGD